MTDPPSDNPYAPPEAPLGPPEPAPPSEGPPPSGAEAIRLAGPQDERFVRALGAASFAAALMAVVGFGFNAWRTRGFLEPSVWEQIHYFNQVGWIARAFVVPPLMVALHIALGFGFGKLAPWARRWQIGLSASVLASFAINRIVTHGIISDFAAGQILAFGIAHVFILYLLTGPRGAMVFSEEYHQAIVATPGIGRSLGPALMTAAILGGLCAGLGDDWVADAIARHLATRLMGAQPDS